MRIGIVGMHHRAGHGLKPCAQAPHRADVEAGGLVAGEDLDALPAQFARQCAGREQAGDARTMPGRLLRQRQVDDHAFQPANRTISATAA